MGAIGGLFHRDGAAADVQAAEKLRKALGPRALSTAATLKTSGPVALVHAALPATPEAVDEVQPVCDSRSESQLIFEGRLDNRADILAATRMSPGSSDAELALGAFLKWDTGFCSRLLGDFAIAVWDPRRHRLLCIRDAIGLKPFYYSSSGSRLVWSTELAAVLSVPWMHLEPSELGIAEQLLFVPLTLTETLYAGVLRLPPAHLLIADESGVRLERYWDIDPDRRVRYRTSEEYAAHLRTLLTEAVRCRMRTVGPLFSDLSGGVDSSTVTALATSLSDSENATVEAFSTVYPGQECDESMFIDAVVERSGVRCSRFEVAPAGAYPYVEGARDSKDRPDFPVTARSLPARLEHAREAGSRAMLTGDGGDEWLGGSAFILADDLWYLRWATLAQRVAARWGTTSPHSVIWNDALKPLVKHRGPKRIRELLLSRRPSHLGSSCINPSFEARISLQSRPRVGLDPQTWAGLSRAALHFQLASPNAVQTAEMMARTASHFGLEYRSPLTDRRVVEFVLATPASEWATPGLTKPLLRRAAGPFLPPAVAWRTDKADFSTVMAEEVCVVGNSLLSLPLLTEEEGWVDGATLRGELAGLRHLYRTNNPTYRKFQWQIWNALAIEIWFRACFSSNDRLEW